MANIFDNLYNSSPAWLQQVGVNIYGLIWKQRRYGGNFQKLVSEFAIRESFTYAEWNEYQERKLREILIHAIANVPYYQNAFQAAGINHHSLESFTICDLVDIPVLEKDTIRSYPGQFISKNSNRRKLHTYLTSGTTGTPLAILSSTQTDRAVQAAYEARVRNWAGLNYKMSRAMLGGRMVIPKAHSRPPFWRYNVFERQLYMSVFHISPTNIKDYISAINKYKPDYLVGYASAQYILARMIEESGEIVHHPVAVLTSSESLTPEMRNTISRVFKCDVYDGYSGVENCCLASECEYHNLHISPDVGIIELVDENGKQVPAGIPGEIVATGFLNFDQPLIRYRTGDLAVSSDLICRCGRNMPILNNILGRIEDTVIGKDGRETVRFHGIFVGLPNVREGQIIQEKLDVFTIRLVVSDGFGDYEKKLIEQRFEQRLGSIKLNFVFVDQIERTSRGKFPAVISHMEKHNS